MRNRKLVEALEDLPEKKLGAGLMYNHVDDCYCAVGAMCLATGKLRPKQVIYGPPGAARILGCHPSEFRHIMHENDGFAGSDEERYDYMLTWAKEDTI